MLRTIIFKSKLFKRITLSRVMLERFKPSKKDATKSSNEGLEKVASKQTTDKQRSGEAAEKLAGIHLSKHGLTFLEKNYHCRHGEIDIIFKDQQTIVFVEVRFRRQSTFGSACASINLRKQRKIVKAAEHYLYKHRLSETVVSRFDVVGITPNCSFSKITAAEIHNHYSVIDDGYGKEYNIEWIRNAFQAF